MVFGILLCTGAEGVVLAGNWPLYFRASSIKSDPCFPFLLIKIPSFSTVTSALPETCCIKLPIKLWVSRFAQVLGVPFSGIGAPMMLHFSQAIFDCRTKLGLWVLLQQSFEPLLCLARMCDVAI